MILIVRAGYYEAPAKQRNINIINEIWNCVEKPKEIDIVVSSPPPKWRRGRGLPFPEYYYRYWAAWQCWLTRPTKWLIIADIDVFPTTKDALFALRDFLLSVPEDVGIVTRVLIGHHPAINECFFNPSEGLVAIGEKFVPSLMMVHLHYHFFVAQVSPVKNMADYILNMEGIITNHLPPAKILFFPPPLIKIVRADSTEPYDTKFIHIGGDNGHPVLLRRLTETLIKLAGG